MDTKRKRIIETCLIFIISTIFFTLIHLTAGLVNYDYIWCFHMSQKVANEYKMYSDIATVIGPIYPLIGGLFVKIFGNHLTSLAIYGGCVMGACTTIMFSICKEISTGKNKYVSSLVAVFAIFVLNTVMLTNYNSLAVMFVLIVVLIEILKAKSNGGFKYNFLIRSIFRTSIFHETKYWSICSNCNICYINDYKYMDNEKESYKRTFS